MATENAANAAEVTETEASDFGFLDDYAGQGLDAITANEMAVSYLGLVQPDSSVQDADNAAGTWRNSATGRNYGNLVRVIVLGFHTIWSEREDNPPFRTVGRYEPNSIKVELKQPAKGKTGYPKMINPESGNEVQELYVYAVMLPDYPEDGILYLNPTVGSMRTCRAWNSQLHTQRLMNGKPAPIFGYQWNLAAGLVPNPQQPSKQIAKFLKAQRDSLVAKDLFFETVKPQLETAPQSLLQIANTMPADTSDVE